MLRWNDRPHPLNARLVERERGIVWLRDPHDCYFVRQSLIHCESPAGFPPVDRLYSLTYFADLVGYAESGEPEGAGGTLYLRRVLWRNRFDRQYNPLAESKPPYPASAVDPITVAPRVVGRKTDRISVHREHRAGVGGVPLATAAPTSPVGRYLTVTEAAKRMGVDVGGLYKRIKRGDVVAGYVPGVTGLRIAEDTVPSVPTEKEPAAPVQPAKDTPDETPIVLLTVAEAAYRANVTDTTIRAWMKKGLVTTAREAGRTGDHVVEASLNAHHTANVKV